MPEAPVRIVVADNQPAFFNGPDDPDLALLHAFGEVAVHSTRSADRSEFLARIEPATALIYLRKPFPLDDQAFSGAPALRVVSFPGVATDSIDLDAARRHRVIVCNLPGANAPAVAEHTIGLLFAIARRIPAADRGMREGRWRKFEGFELRGKTLGLLGLGSIGREVARLGKGLGMEVVAWSHTFDEERARNLGVELVDLDDLFRRSDAVSVHLRSTPDSAGIVGRRQIELMKPGAVLLNTARAALVDEAALIAALRSGRLGGLGLDVYGSEPLALESNPFADLDNVVMTPHMADETAETNARMRRLVVGNVVDFFRGTPRNVMT
jgi:D-3-phosphoglycerate dehydrogenase / 2-oxoglutarate reductase